MTDDELKDRLSAIGGDTKKPNLVKSSSMLPFLSGVCVTALLIGGGIYGYATLVNANKAPALPMPTSETSAFQEDSPLSNFRIAAVDPGASALEAPKEDLETERLKGELALLKEQLEELKNKPAVVKTVAVEDTEKLDQMSARLEEIEKLSAEKEEELAEAKRTELRLMAELESERLLAEQAALDQANAQTEAEEKQRRLVLLEQRRAEARALESRQINSTMVAFKSAAGAKDGAEVKDRYKGDEAFLNNATPAAVTTSEIIANPANTIVQGTIIEATLETAISSDLQGNVTAIISYDVWSYDQSQVLIPRGSKLYGRYSSNVATGQKRVLVAWDRIVTTDAQSVSIRAYGNDRLGRSGLVGQVDNHFLERFGSAALISAIGAVPAVVAAESSDEVTSDTLESVGNDFGQAVGEVMADYLRIKPTIYVDQGSTVIVTVNADLELY